MAEKISREKKNRDGEKGAAMVMVLMLSSLLLVASAGLLLEASMHTTNVTDSTAEQQAYNAAESGIQSAINVLRGNVVPVPLIDASRPATDVANKINFRRAVSTATSNEPADTSTQGRLSRWMNYSYSSTGGAVNDRIPLGSGTYDPQTGYAFNVNVSDPDNTGEIVSFTTSADSSSGKFYDSRDSQWKSSITFGTAPNTATISYISNSASNLNVTGGSANTNFGSFVVAATGTGATITDDIRFQIVVTMTAPYNSTRMMRGTAKRGANPVVTPTSAGTLNFDFDSQAYHIMGSTITLNSDPLVPNPPNSNVGITVIAGNITQAEPYRVLVRSVGFGPNGARKELEAIVQKNFFNGMTAPATLTLVGSNTGFVFNAGNSQNVTYSGDDVASNVIIPPVGTTDASNLTRVRSELCATCKPNTVGTPSDVTPEMPFWLQNPANLDETIQMLRIVAQSSGRYFTAGQTPNNFGDNTNGTGITFVEGDVSYSGAGGGILVCTGKLTLHGGFDFKGLIIVTGANGLDRTGGGNGLLQGNIVIAPYNPNNLAADFLGPKYDISGGGTSEVRYNSSSWDNGLMAISNFVLGVAEK